MNGLLAIIILLGFAMGFLSVLAVRRRQLSKRESQPAPALVGNARLRPSIFRPAVLVPPPPLLAQSIRIARATAQHPRREPALFRPVIASEGEAESGGVCWICGGDLRRGRHNPCA